LKAPGGDIYKQIDQMRLQAFVDVLSPTTPTLQFKVVPVPQQTGSNCGIFLLEFIRAFIEGQRDGTNVNVSEERMVEFRTRLAAELRGINLTPIRKTRIKIKPLKEENKPDPGEVKVQAAEEIKVVSKKTEV
jgi:hypothetical protein